MVVNKSKSTPSLISPEQLSNEDEEIYIVRLPITLTASSIMSLDLNLKSPSRINVQNKEFSPIVIKDLQSKSVVTPQKSDKFSASVLDVKGIVTLRESVQVPPIPKVEIPQPYKVPHPQNLVERHPIYGRQGVAGDKRKLDGEEPEEDVKPKKKKKAEDSVDLDVNENNLEEKKSKKKKKKEKKVNTEYIEEEEIKNEIKDDFDVNVKKSKKKKKDKN